jgi:hypothetical protein
LLQVSKACVIELDETNNVVLRSGLVSMVKAQLARYFEQLVAGKATASIYANNLTRFQRWWPGIQSNSTCLCYLRRRSQHSLPCRHSICKNYKLVFADRSEVDP